jgi:hypothetical protein
MSLSAVTREGFCVGFAAQASNRYQLHSFQARLRSRHRGEAEGESRDIADGFPK